MPIFADAWFWVALFAAHDSAHAKVSTWRRRHSDAELVTTDEVLTETLNYFGGRGAELRGHAVAAIREILDAEGVVVLPQTRESFLAALDLYERRPDKGYSLTDCRSMVVMRSMGLEEVLTGDRHFEQEGFRLAI